MGPDVARRDGHGAGTILIAVMRIPFPRRSRRALTIAWLLAAAALSACGPSLKLTKINSAQRKPNNVWVFFTVERGGEPIGGLAADDFRIYEDGALVSKYESQQVIQNPEVAAVMYTLLLLDVSGSITQSGRIDALVDAAERFIARVGTAQKVGVYAFDGASRLHTVLPFTGAEGALEGALERLRKYRAADPSTNLHGAVVQALAQLRQDLNRDERPLKFGTLVVFSDGADRAGRIDRASMLDALDDPAYAQFERFAIGIGDSAELRRARLEDIGRDGTEEGGDGGTIKQAFDRIAARIAAHSRRFYLLSYCTPARRGSHTVRVEARHANASGSGSLQYTFSADGFGPPPPCDPRRKPSFRLDDVQGKPTLRFDR